MTGRRPRGTVDLAFYVGRLLDDASSREGTLQRVQSYFDKLTPALQQLYTDVADSKQRRANRRLARQREKKERMPRIEVGDFVMCHGTLPGHLRPRHKAATRWNGPYEVMDALTPFTRDVRIIGSEDGGTTVHVNRITRFSGAELEKRVDLIKSAQHDAAQFEVERVLDVRVREGDVQLLIRWLGFNPEDDSWEPAGNLFEFVPRVVLDALQRSNLPEAKLLADQLSADA